MINGNYYQSGNSRMLILFEILLKHLGHNESTCYLMVDATCGLIAQNWIDVFFGIFIKQGKALIAYRCTIIFTRFTVMPSKLVIRSSSAPKNRALDYSQEVRTISPRTCTRGRGKLTTSTVIVVEPAMRSISSYDCRSRANSDSDLVHTNLSFDTSSKEWNIFAHTYL